MAKYYKYTVYTGTQKKGIDLNDEKKGFFESFYRVFSCEKRNEKWYTILIRICIT